MMTTDPNEVWKQKADAHAAAVSAAFRRPDVMELRREQEKHRRRKIDAADAGDVLGEIDAEIGEAETRAIVTYLVDEATKTERAEWEQASRELR